MGFSSFTINSKFRLFVTAEQIFLIPLYHEDKFWQLYPAIIWEIPRDAKELQKRLELACSANFFPAFLNEGETLVKIEPQCRFFLEITCFSSGMVEMRKFEKQKSLRGSTYLEEKRSKTVLYQTSLDQMAAKVFTFCQRLY